MDLVLNAGASAETLSAAMRALGLELPPDYQNFLKTSNGGEGFIGEHYVRLWRAEELEALNAAYEVARDAPTLLLFGTDGGGEAFAFDKRQNPWSVVQVPFIGMSDPGVAIPMGRSFTEFLTNRRR